MKINSGAINELSAFLEQAQMEGARLICYYEEDTHFDKHEIETFSNDYDAREYYYETATDVDQCSIAPLVPVLEAIKVLQQSVAALEGREGSVSFPFDIPLIVEQYQLKEKLKASIMSENIEKTTEEKTIEEKMLPLEKRFKFSGMGDISREELKRNLIEGQPSFHVGLKGKIDEVMTTLDALVKLSKKGEYYPQSYDLTIHPEGQPSYSRNYEFKRSLPVHTLNEDGSEKVDWINSTITRKEAFNQMMGRAVNKDYVFENKDDPKKNRKFNAWEYIDYTKPAVDGKHPIERIYDFDMDKKMEGYQFKFANKNEEENFIPSLKRGNCQSVINVNADGSTDLVYFLANPRGNEMKVFDKNMNEILLSIKAERNVAEGLPSQPDQTQPGQQTGQDLNSSVNEGLSVSNNSDANVQQDVSKDVTVQEGQTQTSGQQVNDNSNIPFNESLSGSNTLSVAEQKDNATDVKPQTEQIQMAGQQPSQDSKKTLKEGMAGGGDPGATVQKEKKSKKRSRGI
ncbi:hypothetical protein [Pedobacter nutrimenti]|uniref:hypothetical protein n=1 Tax=Pedobacter nutrimenti TaxID=1241337 RepID=UPI002930F063|nr:hypothetical protein [Pedobacter nutrimenti]